MNFILISHTRFSVNLLFGKKYRTLNMYAKCKTFFNIFGVLYCTVYTSINNWTIYFRVDDQITFYTYTTIDEITFFVNKI